MWQSKINFMISQDEFHVAKQIKNDHEDIVQKTLKNWVSAQPHLKVYLCNSLQTFISTSCSNVLITISNGPNIIHWNFAHCKQQQTKNQSGLMIKISCLSLLSRWIPMSNWGLCYSHDRGGFQNNCIFTENRNFVYC